MEENNVQRFEEKIGLKYYINFYIPSYFRGKRFIQSISYDITDIKEAEALIEKEAELRKLNATKDKFFSIIAHDLKSPFSAIIGFSDMLVKNLDTYDKNKIKNVTENIYQASLNSFKLLENLLEWSISQTGRLEFNPKEHLAELIATKAIRNMETVAGSKNIKTACEITEQTIVFADKNMLKTILRNLLSNAIKFTPEGGEVILKVSPNKESILFEIIDNGIGMTKNTINKLFKMEEKVSMQGTNNEKGTGLGLILCMEFIKKHNGRIWAESEKKKGSRFCFTLNLINS